MIFDARSLAGDVIYRREECLAQASICREKAHADPARHDYWIDEAIFWLQRAIGPGREIALARELHHGA